MYDNERMDSLALDDGLAKLDNYGYPTLLILGQDESLLYVLVVNVVVEGATVEPHVVLVEVYGVLASKL